jgi:RNA polymerase sigma-70 factor (ECF subfamily)
MAADREELKQSLARLPPDCRDVLLLAAMEGLTGPEIAECLEIPLGTVHSRLARARELINDALEANCRNPRGKRCPT